MPQRMKQRRLLILYILWHVEEHEDGEREERLRRRREQCRARRNREMIEERESQLHARRAREGHQRSMMSTERDKCCCSGEGKLGVAVVYLNQ